MQILYVHRHFSTPQGSVGTHAYETARRLVERGHQVTIVCGGFGANNIGLDGAFRRGKREGNVDGIRVMEYQLGNSHAPNWLARCVATSIFALRCVAVALREPYDVLCATSTPPIASILGVCASLLRRKPMVLEVRVLWSERLKALGIIKNPIWCGVASTLEWISYHSATRFVALSPMIAESIQIRGIPASHIKMIPNGCDIALFAAPVSAWRPAEVRQDDVMAVYAGAHEHANGLLSVLHAAAELKRRGAQHIKVVLVGAGQFKQMLVEYARQEKLDNVLFLDAVPKTKLAGLMATADIGLQ
ncbi:MAG: glycosyltransferase family 4 protein, partial [Rickettsiales bacterium]